ncbi:MAG: ParB/RepB/Spo0J family partition protein, partial [Acidimicrobiales bacterium]
LRNLVASIRLQGILQPLRVERSSGGSFLRIRAGHRRAAAAGLAGLRKVPCVIVDACDTDVAIAEMFAENLHRAGLTTAEKRDNARRLIDEFGYTPEGVAEATGVHFTTVYSWLRNTPQKLVTRPDGRRQRAGARNAHFPRLKPTDLHALMLRWRAVAGCGLDAAQANALLAEVEALLGGWTPMATTSTSVSAVILARVVELDPRNTRPVQDVAYEIGCSTKLVERARAAIRRTS